MPNSIVACILALMFTTGCATRPPCDTTFQTSTIDALLVGLYDGNMSLAKLGTHGDFGLGTFNALDGEMILLDGVFYQVKSDGKIYRPSLDIKTPFATVCRFQGGPDIPLDPDSDYESVKTQIDHISPNQNLFTAIMIEGSFDFVKTRSVPRQEKPYPPLTQVAKTQPEFMIKNVKGVVVGFRSPPFVKGLNVPGYHLHFLSEDKDAGGHILDFKIKEGVCRIDLIDRFNLALPGKSADFGKTDLTKDLSKDLEHVEK